MSVTQVPLQPLKKGSMLKLWLGIALIVVAAVALAWVGTDRFRGEMTANGVFIRTLDAGTGDPIRVNDGVLVEYEGRLADGKVFEEPVLKDIAAAKGRSVAQIVLRWIIQQPGLVVLSKTVSEARAAENLAIFDFELSSEEMAAIFALARPDGRIVSPGNLAPKWD